MRLRSGDPALIVAIAGYVLVSSAAIAQLPSATIIYTEQSTEAQPATFTLTIDESGAGHYRSEVSKVRSSDPNDVAPISLDRDITVSKVTRDKLFATARRRHFFSAQCDANGNKPHVQSTKTLAYSGSDGKGQCTFIWSKDDQISDLSDTLEGIQATLEEGARLRLIYQYQPLVCKNELEAFASQVQARQALEVVNIAPLLQKIANDDKVLHGCRQAALQILTLAKIE
jgi:hypothetical protein